jgi:DNA repair protein RadA/Sms
LRILRAAKNRFGATSETGVFTMSDVGLTEVGNPSELLLAERGEGRSGSAVIVTLEGTRPLLLEIQALVSGEGFPNPRRVATGIDPRRLAVLLAVLERRGQVPVSSSDVFVNVTGGLRAVEPAIDLGTILAVASSQRDVPVPDDLVAIGEIGLGGEIRRVGQLERRIAEAAKLGFRRAAVPASAAADLPDLGVTLVPVAHVQEALETIFRPTPGRVTPEPVGGTGR